MHEAREKHAIIYYLLKKSLRIQYDMTLQRFIPNPYFLVIYDADLLVYISIKYFTPDTKLVNLLCQQTACSTCMFICTRISLIANSDSMKSGANLKHLANCLSFFLMTQRFELRKQILLRKLLDELIL